jgi:hypothetical protein
MKPLCPFESFSFQDFLFSLGDTDKRYIAIERAGIIEDGCKCERKEAERRTINEWATRHK